MAKLIAVTMVIAHVQNKRIQFKPGDEVTGLAAHDVAELKRLGSVRDTADEEAAAKKAEEQQAAVQAAFAATRAALQAADESIKPAANEAAEVAQEAPADADGGAAKPAKTAKPKA
jgi:hypothetical protein